MAAIRRLDRVLRHHDSTLRALHESGTALEREAFSLLVKRLRRLQAELESVQVDRIALIAALERLGVNLEQTDATVGRSLRRILGVPRVHRGKRP